ncbi:MAG: hypothetical protein ACI4U3_10095 [Traorella sp.]
MVKLLLILFFLFGCTSRRVLEPLENDLYDFDIVYVVDDFERVEKLLNINRNDYIDGILLKSLVVYEQTFIYVFQNPSSYLLEQLKQYCQNGYYEKTNQFVFYVSDSNPKIISLIQKYLYEIEH